MPTSRRPRLYRHPVALLTISVLCFLWSWPLPARLHSVLPGEGAGDNVCFLWNFWWMREALAAGTSFFYCPLLFAPNGVDLALHTHTALPAFIGATLLGALSEAAALNTTIIASIFLAALCTYVLCWRLTRDVLASVVAAVVFAGAPYLSAHLQGHFNLTHTWVFPLFGWLAYESMRTQSRLFATTAGLVWGLTAYIDYYYVVYQALLLAILWVAHARVFSIRIMSPTPVLDYLRRAAAVLVVLLLALVILISASGGLEFTLWSTRVSARSVFNPLQALWIAVAVWIWARFRPVVSRLPGSDGEKNLANVAWTLVVFLIVSLPLSWLGMRALLRGTYVTQDYHWRSGPAGIDAATLFAGNPFHPVWGEFVRDLYRARGIEPVEHAAFLGLSVIVLAAWAVRNGWRDPGIRTWTITGAVFLLWALGPHLEFFGWNSGMILPNAVLRYLPIVSNARMPGRAIVVVYLALALLGSYAIVLLRSRADGRRWILLAVVMILVEFARAPIVTTPLPDPGVYRVLAERTEQGAVLDLPFGVRDGFGEAGRLDEWSLYYQTVHGRPLVGGFAARVPSSIHEFYRSDPLFSTLLQLSAGTPAVTEALTRAAVAERLARHNVRFVSLDRQSASPELIRFVSSTMPLTLLTSDTRRALYLVENPGSRER